MAVVAAQQVIEFERHAHAYNVLAKESIVIAISKADTHPIAEAIIAMKTGIVIDTNGVLAPKQLNTKALHALLR